MSKFMLSMGLGLAALIGLAGAGEAKAPAAAMLTTRVSAYDADYKEFTCHNQDEIDYYYNWLLDNGYSADVEQEDWNVWLVYGYKF